MTGRIRKESPKVQIAFLELCCQYWKNRCNMTYVQACLEISDSVAILEKRKLINIEGDHIYILFLDEQMREIEATSAQRSNAARSRWSANAKQNNAGAMQVHASALQNGNGAMQIDADKIRQEQKREEETYPTRQKAFEFITKNYPDTETAIKILANRGWKSAQQPQVEALLFHFLELHWASDKSAADTRKHFRNWLNRENLDNLTKLSITIHERLKA